MILDEVNDKNPKDKDGTTPLHWAANKGHFEIFKLIMESADEKSPVDNHGDTLLHYAADAGHFDVCKHILIKNVTNKSHLNNVGKTPKDFAIRNGHMHLLSLFE